MHQDVGIWIDHKEAFLSFAVRDAEHSQHIASNMEKHVRFSGGSHSSDGAADDQRDRQFTTHLNHYYDDVISHLKDARAIFVFGPGEAKGEFEKRLTHHGMESRVVGVETTDKMTTAQIAAKTLARFSL